MVPEDDRMIETCRSVLNYNFSEEQSMVPEDDRMIEHGMSVLNCNFSKEKICSLRMIV